MRGKVLALRSRLLILLLYLALLLAGLLLALSTDVRLTAWGAVTLAALLALALFQQRGHLEAILGALLRRIAGWALWRNRWACMVAAPFFYLIATIISTWPYVRDFATAIPGWPMDNFNFLYKIWWVSHALFGSPPPGSSLTFNPAVFYPAGYNLAQGELSPANTLLTIPITATLGPIISYNFLVFLSFVLSGWGMYLLVKYLLGSVTSTSPRSGEGATAAPDAVNLRPYAVTLIALMCGLAFAFCPYRMEQMGGHLQMLGTEWLPFTFLFLEKMLRTQRLSAGALAGLCFALCCWEAWYYAAIIGLFVAIYVPLRWWQLRERPARLPAPAAVFSLIATNPPLKPQTSTLKPLLTFLSVTAIMVLPFALPYLQLGASDNLTYTAAQANENSALPTDYFIPSFLNPLWGETFAPLHAGHNPLEQDLYLGVVPFGLMLVAIGLRRRLRGAFPFALYLLIAGLAFILSFGSGINEWKLLNNWGYSGIDPRIDVWMPGWLVYRFVPLFDSLRAYARFGLLVIFAVIVLAALGLVLLLTRPRFARYSYLTIAALTLILLADFAASPYAFGMTRVANEPENVWLAAQPGNAPVALFPTDYAMHDGQATWFSIYHGKPIAYGYESFLPSLLRQPAVQTALDNFPDDASVWPLLQGWGVKYVMVSTLWWGSNWPSVRQQLAASGHLQYLAHFDEQPLWDGDARLWDNWPQFKWHALPDDLYIYQLIYPPATAHSP
jgi:hypothetical protein